MFHFKSLFQNESGLGHRTFRRVNKKDNAVYHFQDTFYFTAEVSVSGGIDNIEFCAFIMYGGIFCKNGNAAFLFDSVGVHNAVFGGLVFSVNATLFQHFVYKSCLTVVNVSDDRDVS